MRRHPIYNPNPWNSSWWDGSWPRQPCCDDESEYDRKKTLVKPSACPSACPRQTCCDDESDGEFVQLPLINWDKYNRKVLVDPIESILMRELRGTDASPKIEANKPAVPVKLEATEPGVPSIPKASEPAVAVNDSGDSKLVQDQTVVDKFLDKVFSLGQTHGAKLSGVRELSKSCVVPKLLSGPFPPVDAPVVVPDQKKQEPPKPVSVSKSLSKPLPPVDAPVVVPDQKKPEMMEAPKPVSAVPPKSLSELLVEAIVPKERKMTNLARIKDDILAKTEDDECVFCLENRRIVMNLGCGHVLLCLKCCMGNVGQQMTECGKCRQSVTEWFVCSV